MHCRLQSNSVGAHLTILARAGAAVIWNAVVHAYEAVTWQSKSKSKKQSRAGSVANSTSRSKRDKLYVVRVQVQGVGLKFNPPSNYITIHRAQPVTLQEVHAALTVTASGLSAAEKVATAPAFAAASRWTTKVAAGGGIGPVGNVSFGNGKDPNSVYRVDIDVVSGHKNIV